MPRETRPAPPTLDQEQRVLTTWLDRQKLWWHYTPVTLFKHDARGLKFKSLGYKPGPPDVMIFTPVPNVPEARGVAIKLMRLRSAACSIEANIWLKQLERQGWLAREIRGAPKAIEWLESLGFGAAQALSAVAQAS